MNLKWAATLVIVVGALAAWRVAAMKPNRSGPANPDIAAAAPLDARGAALAKEISRLHDRLDSGEPPRLGRNLFRFAARRPAPVALAANHPVIEPATAPPPPALTLIGVAEDTAGGEPIRTAIISGLGQVYVVKVGERVTSRYVVARISADVVELRDLGSQDLDAAAGNAGVRRLALK
jgi:hypothetical protein